MSGRPGRDAGMATTPALVRFEVFVRLEVDGEPFSMRVPDVYARDGKDALRQARAVHGHLAVVRGIDATRA